MSETLRVDVRPALLEWACERNGVTSAAFVTKFPQLADWLQGVTKPTLKQLEAFAKSTYTPLGYLFLEAPPKEPVPIPDFRTVGSGTVDCASPNLLETIYLSQQRQEWYRDFARTTGERPLAFVGSLRVGEDEVAAARAIRSALAFDLQARQRAAKMEEALRMLVDQAEALGVLVMVSGIVRSDTHRKLDPDEFRGFALTDEYAPLIFINGADAKAAQIFTLAHELAHLWCGKPGVSDVQASDVDGAATERWCNSVAAEILVPLESLRADLAAGATPDPASLAKRYKVSTLVLLRRLFDAGIIDRDEMNRLYAMELGRLRAARTSSTGGDFYRTHLVRVGKRFARAVYNSTDEQRTLRRDAFQLLGLTAVSTFDNLRDSLGVA